MYVCKNIFIELTGGGCSAVVLNILSFLLSAGSDSLPVEGRSLLQGASKATLGLGGVTFVDLHALNEGEGILGSVTHVNGGGISRQLVQSAQLNHVRGAFICALTYMTVK